MPVNQAASAYAFHTDYGTPNSVANDVSLVLLSAAVPLSNAVKTIQLPPRSDFSVDYTGKSVTAMGFGQAADGSYPRYLQYTYLTTLSAAECKQQHWVFLETMLCGRGNAAYGNSICYGDSGKI